MRGDLIFIYTTKSTVLFSVEKGFKGEVNECENEAHCAAEDRQDLSARSSNCEKGLA